MINEKILLDDLLVFNLEEEPGLPYVADDIVAEVEVAL
jgi:hypothetical protein